MCDLSKSTTFDTFSILQCLPSLPAESRFLLLRLCMLLATHMRETLTVDVID